MMKHGDRVTSEQLAGKWNETQKHYDSLIESGFKLSSIQSLVQHIIQAGHSASFFPVASLYDLHISLPNDDRIDHTRTLSVSFDHRQQKVLFNYEERSASMWSIECEATEITNTFEHFLGSHSEWRDASATKVK